MKVNRTARDIEHLLPQIKTLLKELYGNRLVDGILFGSFARNKASEDSDIDIAVVLKGKVSKMREITKIGDALYELMLETGELISVHPVSEDELKNSIWPLYYHIRTEGLKI